MRVEGRKKQEGLPKNHQANRSYIGKFKEIPCIPNKGIKHKGKL